MSAQSTRRSQSSVGGSLTLLSAMKKGHFHVIRDLVDRGCNVNERDQEMRTPLILCAVVEDEKWSLSVARLLIENGAKIWLSDKTGKNALMAACLNERQSLVDVLLESLDFNLNAQDKFGCTALHHCAMCGNVAIARIVLNRLLRYDLPILVANKDNKTPVDCSLQLGYYECAQLIAADAKTQQENLDRKKLEERRKRREEREKVTRKHKLPTTISVLNGHTMGSDGTNGYPVMLATVTEGGSTHAAASYVDAETLELPAVDLGSVPNTVNDQNFKPLLEDALNQLETQDKEKLYQVRNTDLEDVDEPDLAGSPKEAAVSRPKTAASRKMSHLTAKPALSSTPRVRSAVPNAKPTNHDVSVTSVLKHAKDREMTAKRQDFRRALSALPNRKRVRESKISSQSRRAGEIFLTRPRTAMSTSVVLNREDFGYTPFVRPLFEVYREHLTDAFRPSVAALQATLERERLKSKDEMDGYKGKESPLTGRESVDSKKAKSKRKPSLQSKRK